MAGAVGDTGGITVGTALGSTGIVGGGAGVGSGRGVVMLGFVEINRLGAGLVRASPNDKRLIVATYPWTPFRSEPDGTSNNLNVPNAGCTSR